MNIIVTKFGIQCNWVLESLHHGEFQPLERMHESFHSI